MSYKDKSDTLRVKSDTVRVVSGIQDFFQTLRSSAALKSVFSP